MAVVEPLWLCGLFFFVFIVFIVFICGGGCFVAGDLDVVEVGVGFFGVVGEEGEAFDGGAGFASEVAACEGFYGAVAEADDF